MVDKIDKILNGIVKIIKAIRCKIACCCKSECSQNVDPEPEPETTNNKTKLDNTNTETL